MDAKNSPTKHITVAALSLAVIILFRFAIVMPWPMAFARVSYILLFLILIIGPLQKIKDPAKKASANFAAWSWRGELGIWCTITAVVHFILLWIDRSLGQMIQIGGNGYGLANVIGLVALVWAIILAISSLNTIIMFLGLRVWKWVHSFTYVVFYLVVAHIGYFQFFSTDNGVVHTNWFGYLMIVMATIVLILQCIAFVSVVSAHRNKLEKKKA